MTQPGSRDSGNAVEEKLPRRDFVILPLLSLLTIATCLAAAEMTSRHFFAADVQDTCQIDGAAIDAGHIPNCTTRLKAAEGPWVTNQYNDCGYRTKESCGPKPIGSERIALIGSSESEGLYVAYDETFATRTAGALTRILGRPVEVQNLARTPCSLICVSHQVDEALALKPDLLLLAIDPYDVEYLDPAQMSNRYSPSIPREGPPASSGNSNPLARISLLAKNSSSMVAGEHFLFQNASTYARIYLHYGDHADYLRTGFSPAWDRRFDALEVLLAEMARKADTAKVPFVLIEIPSVAQASLSAEKTLPAGVDPYGFNERLKQIASRRGIEFIDGLEALKGGPEVNKLFYVTDGHINAEGHALIARALVEQLTKGEGGGLLGRNEAYRETASEQIR